MTKQGVKKIMDGVERGDLDWMLGLVLDERIRVEVERKAEGPNAGRVRGGIWARRFARADRVKNLLIDLMEEL